MRKHLETRQDRNIGSYAEEKTKKTTADCLDVMNIWANKRLNNNGTYNIRKRGGGGERGQVGLPCSNIVR